MCLFRELFGDDDEDKPVDTARDLDGDGIPDFVDPNPYGADVSSQSDDPGFDIKPPWG